MVEKISSEQAYVNYVMGKLPESKKGAVHTMRKGDNLWNIAKKELNKKNATNQEISEYMLLIAKLNNLNTIEKMNNLRVNDKIYLPEAGTVQKMGNNTTENQTSAERSILQLKNIILTDQTIKVEKMYKGYEAKDDLYHVYNEYTYPETGFKSHKHPLMTFVMDKNTGNIKSITYNDQEKRLNTFSYDYVIDEKGQIVKNSHTDKKQKAGKIDKQELEGLHSELKKLTENSTYFY